MLYLSFLLSYLLIVILAIKEEPSMWYGHEKEAIGKIIIDIVCWMCLAYILDNYVFS